MVVSVTSFSDDSFSSFFFFFFCCCGPVPPPPPPPLLPLLHVLWLAQVLFRHYHHQYYPISPLLLSFDFSYVQIPKTHSFPCGSFLNNSRGKRSDPFFCISVFNKEKYIALPSQLLWFSTNGYLNPFECSCSPLLGFSVSAFHISARRLNELYRHLKEGGFPFL